MRISINFSRFFGSLLDRNSFTRVGRGECAGEVETDAPEKLAVAREFRRDNPEFPKLVHHELVDEVRARYGRIVRTRVRR